MFKYLRIIYALYGALIFIISLILVYPCFLFIFLVFDEKKAPHIAHQWVTHPWGYFLFFFWMVKRKVYGAEKIDPKKTYVFVGNHLSLLDIPAFANSNKNTFRFLAKEELTKVPILGYVIKRVYLTVNRKDRADRRRSLEAMMRSIHDGISVFICPEGTRNKSGVGLLPFKDGAFHLALETGTPIAVLTIYGTNKILPTIGPWSMRPGSISMQWSEPIETKNLKPTDLVMLKEKVRNLMLDSLEQLDKK